MKTVFNKALLGQCFGLLALLTMHSANAQNLELNFETDLLINQTVTKTNALGIPTNQPKAVITLSDKLQFKPGAKLNQDNYSAKAEIWTNNNWGLIGSIEVNGLEIIDSPKNSETKSIDLKRKLINSEKSNSFLALGLGWQDINLDEDIDAEGINISLLGKWSFSDNFQVYGKGAIFEGLNNDDSNYSVSGYRFETGVKYKVGKKLSFSAGVKVQDFEDQQTNTRNSSSSLLLGTHLSF